MIRLKELRQHFGYTQQELANIIGTKRNTLCDWELGRTEPSSEYIIKLANTFKVPVDYLLDYEVPSDIQITSIKQLSIINIITNSSTNKQSKIYNILTNLKGINDESKG